MKKYIVLMSLIAFVLVGGLIYIKKINHSPSQFFKDNDINSYEISGVLELVDEEALKRVNIQSIYKKVDTSDYYYVRLEDQDTKQVQTIVKNDEGVFVLAQGFNRAFQFKTEWPNNGFKPYILQNIMDLFKDKHKEEKIRDGFVLTADIKDPTHPQIKQTQILFDQNLALTQINLLDEHHNEIIHFEVTTYIINPEVDKTIFTLDSMEEIEVTVEEELPIYPLESYNSELIDQLKTSDGHILRYKGDKYFTLIQTPMIFSQTLDLEVISSDFLIYEDGLIYNLENQATIISNGVKTTIYSKELTSDEKLNILLSIENNIVFEP